MVYLIWNCLHYIIEVGSPFFHWFIIKAVDKSVCATINDVNSLGEQADDYFFLLQIKKYTSHVYKNASPIQFRVRG